MDYFLIISKKKKTIDDSRLNVIKAYLNEKIFESSQYLSSTNNISNKKLKRW